LVTLIWAGTGRASDNRLPASPALANLSFFKERQLMASKAKSSSNQKKAMHNLKRKTAAPSAKELHMVRGGIVVTKDNDSATIGSATGGAGAGK
jgi:hypothetical protein